MKIFNVLVIICAPILEELSMRGPTLFYVLNQKWSLIALPIFLSSFIWAVPHKRGLVVFENKLYLRDWGWLGFNQLFLMGLLYSISVVVARSLWPAFLAHTINNFGFIIQSNLPDEWIAKVHGLLKTKRL